MIQKYLIIALVLIGIVGGAYWQGRRDGVATIKAANLDAYEKALVTEQTARDARIRAEGEARVASERYTRSVRNNLDQVKEDFSGIPQVVLNSDGCADLSDAFRLRWNASEQADIQTGSSAGSSDARVRETHM